MAAALSEAIAETTISTTEEICDIVSIPFDKLETLSWHPLSTSPGLQLIQVVGPVHVSQSDGQAKWKVNPKNIWK